MPPTGDDVRRQLDRLLASSGFANAGRMSRFLRFVVEQSLAGEGERLKEYVIGVEVFDRDANYDPRVDSIVRVEAARLRTKLTEYYAGEGREDAIVLTLPKGGYAPVVQIHDHRSAIDGAPATNGTASAASAPPRTRARAAVGVVPVGRRRAVGGRSDRRSHGMGAEASRPRRRCGSPSCHSWPSRAPPRVKRSAQQLTEGVTAELVRDGRFAVVASSAARAEVFACAQAARHRHRPRRRHRYGGAHDDGRRAAPRRGASRERPDRAEALGPRLRSATVRTWTRSSARSQPSSPTSWVPPFWLEPRNNFEVIRFSKSVCYEALLTY